MEPKTRLTHNLLAESEAYGYTLTIWGAGALLINTYGTPGLSEVFLYIGGALSGFAALGAVAFDSITTAPNEQDRQVVVVSIIHVLATMGNLVVSFLVIQFVTFLHVPNQIGFAVVGFQATAGYNILLLLETYVSRILLQKTPFTESLD